LSDDGVGGGFLYGDQGVAAGAADAAALAGGWPPGHV
jgi:hypothetical protein